jgi:hypothetical protein
MVATVRALWRMARGPTFRWGLRLSVLFLIAVAAGSLVLIPFVGKLPHFFTVARLASSSGLILDIAGILQLEVSGAFEKLTGEFFDKEKWPNGPPSNVTRQIIDNPYTPIWNKVQSRMYFDHGTGIWLLFFGFVFQLAGVWILV